MKAFTRPKLGLNPVVGSVDASILLLTSPFVLVGFLAHTNAATPATWGLAMEVPLREP